MPDNEKPGSSNNELHEWGKSVLDDGLARRRSFEGQWWENIATYLGDFWVEWDPHRRRLWEPVKKPKHRARIPVNLAQPIVRTELAKLTKNRPIVDVIAASNELSALNSAEVGDKILNQYAERQFHMPRVRREMLHWVLICGSGGIFVDYDDSLEDPIEVYEVNGSPIFDNRVIEAYQKRKKKKPDTASLKKMTIPKGDLVIKALSPMQYVYDFTVNDPVDAWWMVITEVMDINLVEKRWGVLPQAEENIEPGVIETRMLSRMDLTQTLRPPAPKSQKMVKVHRLFVKPGHPYFPKGCELIFTDNEYISGGNFPFRHGQLPVSVMGHVPLPTTQYDMSTLQQVRPLTMEVSRTESQMVEARNLIANPIWLEPVQARIEGEIVNRPGARIKYNHVPNVPPPSPAQMPDMPAYVQALPELMQRHIQDISGQGDTSQGRIPAGARSGVSIAYLQEEDDTKLGPTVSQFEETIERVAWQLLETVAEKYDAPRTVQLYRRHGEPEVLDFYGEMLNGCAGVQVQAGSALPRSKAAKQQFILDLWDRKLEQDPRRVREMLELTTGDPDEWEIDIDQADRENRKMQNGDPVEVKDWHNHPAHLYRHHNYMKSAEFEEELDPEAQQLFEQHCAEHEAAQQQQSLETAQLSAMGGNGVGPEAGIGAAANGTNVPEGAPGQFSGASPRSVMDQEPQ